MLTLRSIALDDSGPELARDELRLNTGSQPLRRAPHGAAPRREVPRQPARRAEIDVPDGRVVERVEFYLNESLVSTLYQPPFAQPILPGTEQLAYVRAVAYLPDGKTIEDLVFVNSPDHLEELDIQLVELYTTVLDGECGRSTGWTAGLQRLRGRPAGSRRCASSWSATCRSTPPS